MTRRPILRHTGPPVGTFPVDSVEQKMHEENLISNLSIITVIPKNCSPNNSSIGIYGLGVNCAELTCLLRPLKRRRNFVFGRGLVLFNKIRKFRKFQKVTRKTGSNFSVK